MRIKPVYGRIVAYSFIPIIMIIIGTYAGIFILPSNLTVNLDQEYQQSIIDQHQAIGTEMSEEIAAILLSYESHLNVLEVSVSNILNQGEVTNRPSYFHDIQQDKITPRPEFSDFYNQTVDFSVSSYFVGDNLKFGNYSTELNESIAITSIMDLTFLSIYPTIDHLVWIDVYFSDVNMERTYPFVGPKSANHTVGSRIDDAPSVGTTADNISYSEPYLDNTTNQIVITISKSINLTGYNGSYIAFTIGIHRLFEQIRGHSQPEQSSFLLVNTDTVFMHSSYNRTSDVITNGTMSSIYSLETNSSELSVLLNTSTSSMQIAIIDYANLGEVVVGSVNIGVFQFGFTSILETKSVIGTYDLIELIIVPLIVVLFIIGCIMVLLRRYGLLRNVGLETLVQLEQNVSSKMQALADGEVDSVGELVTKEIKDKGEELREHTREGIDRKVEEVRDTVNNLDRVINTKMDTTLDSLENKLISAIDNKFSQVDDFIQQAKGTITLSSDQIRNLLGDPEAFIQNQMAIFANSSELSLDNIKNLPNKTTRLMAIVTSQSQIDLPTFSSIIDVPVEDLTKISMTIPDEYGIVVEEDQVKFNHELILSHSQDILQVFYQLVPQKKTISSESVKDFGSAAISGSLLDSKDDDRNSDKT